MKTRIYRVTFDVIMSLGLFWVLTLMGINPFLIGLTCGVSLKVWEKLFFLLFPKTQRHLIRFTNRVNEFDYFYLASMVPEDDRVGTKKIKNAYHFNTKLEAKNTLLSIDMSRGDSPHLKDYYGEVIKRYH